MRTTLTLDSDVADLLRRAQHQMRKPFKEVVNEVLRRGLAADTQQRRQKKRFRVTPQHCGFRDGIDVLRLNQVSDDLEIKRSLKTHGKR